MNRQSPLYIILFMTALTVIAGFAVSVVNYASLDILKKNESALRNRIIASAFRLETGKDSVNAESIVKEKIEEILIPAGDGNIRVFKNRENGETGFVFSGTGFWDRITGLLVLSPDLDVIRDIKFIEQKETPGLGARIEEKSFTDSFRELKIYWSSSIDKRIIIGTSPDNTAQNRVDAITGATQTSVALMDMINRDLEAFRKAYAEKGGN